MIMSLRSRSTHGRATELFTENAQKGELYRITFVDDPVSYVGMPVGAGATEEDDSETFRFKIVEPRDRRGVRRYSVHDVAWLERLE